MKKNNNLIIKSMIILFLYVIGLTISFFTSLYTINYVYSFGYIRVFFDVALAVILIKLVIIMITYKYSLKSTKTNHILVIVSLFNLANIVLLYYIKIEYVFEVATLNYLFDIILISISHAIKYVLYKEGDKDELININDAKEFAFFEDPFEEGLTNKNTIVAEEDPFIRISSNEPKEIVEQINHKKNNKENKEINANNFEDSYEEDLIHKDTIVAKEDLISKMFTRKSKKSVEKNDQRKNSKVEKEIHTKNIENSLEENLIYQEASISEEELLDRIFSEKSEPNVEIDSNERHITDKKINTNDKYSKEDVFIDFDTNTDLEDFYSDTEIDSDLEDFNLGLDIDINLMEFDSHNINSEISLDMKTLIIAKNIEEHCYMKLKEDISNSTVFNLDSNNNGYGDFNGNLTILENIISENKFDDIAIHSQNIFRLEFLDILETVNKFSLSISLVQSEQEKFSIIHLLTIRDIIKSFPLNVNYDSDIHANNVLLLFTGYYCEGIIRELINNINIITIIDCDSIINKIRDIFGDNEKITYINFEDESELENELSSQNYDYLIYSLQLKDTNLCESEIKVAIDKNIIFSKRILSLVEDKIQKFVFISSSKANKPVSVLGACYKNVEVMVQAINKYTEINYQIIRLPEAITRYSPLLSCVDGENIIEVDINEAFSNMYTTKEAAKFLTGLIQLNDPVIIYMGSQSSLPELFKQFNCNIMSQEELSINLKNKKYPMQLYTDSIFEREEYEIISYPYVYKMLIENTDYFIVLKIISIMENKLKEESDEVCKDYLRQLALGYQG
ncbi:MAG: polysaccharide biosynthesis protein [Eubacteriaceae bacterium]